MGAGRPLSAVIGLEKAACNERGRHELRSQAEEGEAQREEKSEEAEESGKEEIR